LAWSGIFAGAGRVSGKGPDGAPATLVFLPEVFLPGVFLPGPLPQPPADPWFVRMAGYPGVGLSLAWEKPAIASHDQPLHRRVTVLVADGLLATGDIQQLITTLGESA